MLISIILSGLALLAATVCIILHLREKKRNLKRNAALVDYVDSMIEEAKNSVRFELREEISSECRSIFERHEELAERIRKLETGIVPDFEEAKLAARAVDDFNKGLSNILGFDPIQSLQKERQKTHFGGEVE